MYTKAQLDRMFYQQDRKWADMVTKAIRQKHRLAKRAKAFLDNEWSRTVNHWQAISRSVPVTADAIDELLGFFHHSLYPAARDVGFTDSSFVFPDIGLEGRDYRYPVPQFQVSGFFDALKTVLKSKKTKQVAYAAAPFIPGGTTMLGTLDKINSLVHDAKEGDPVAVETVRAIKVRSDLGDPSAKNTIATIAVVSKAQSIKTAKSRSLYARGMTVGHDPITFGAVRDQRGGKGGGGGTSVTSFTRYAPPKARAKVTSEWHNRSMDRLAQSGPPVLANLPPHLKDQWKKYDQAMTPQAPPPGQQPLPPGQDPYADPYAQYGYPPYDPYAGYGGYGGYDPYGGYNPYGLQGLPPGYGYEEPVIDRGGFQQYDPETGMFYSSNQKQVYDEATGYFVPVQDIPNPYGF